MTLFKCKMCGGSLEIAASDTVATCEYCGTQQTLPKLDDDKRANRYDRANHFRRNNDFDKAMGIYEQILNEDTTDAEAYWSLVLCRYGIEYVEDPASHKRIPTVNRAQFTSIFDDDNYKSALQYADSYQRSIYEAEAKAINEIQKGILAISQKEEPFDVFICYKESDNNGRRTPDSVLANDLYHQLTQEGFKVFFARITLEDKLGSAYEPYIFAALNSAKVMVVMGTKPEYFNAVWVKNEWSRYLALIKNGAKKMLIPAYKDMDPYDLPDEFSHLQAQDMGKLGFMQDLIRGIKKITAVEEPKTTVVKETVVATGNANTAPLLKRVFMFLEDGDWKSADEYSEKVLDIDPECADAYIGKFLSQTRSASLHNWSQKYIDSLPHVEECSHLVDIDHASIEAITHSNLPEYFLKKQDLQMLVPAVPCYNTTSESRLQHLQEAKSLIENNKALNHAKRFATKQQSDTIEQVTSEVLIALEERLNAAQVSDATNKAEAEHIYRNSLDEALQKATTLRTTAEQKCEAHYLDAQKQYAESTTVSEVILLMESLSKLVGYKDIKALFENCKSKLDALGDKYLKQIAPYQGKILATAPEYAVVLRTQKLFSIGNKVNPGAKVQGTNQTAVACGQSHTLALDSSDGTVIAGGDRAHNKCDVSKWRNIVSIAAGYNHSLGLTTDGYVLSCGNNSSGQCNVALWSSIVSISAGFAHTVGLKGDGTVVATGDNSKGQCNVSHWTDVIAISAGPYYTIALTKNGTILSTGIVAGNTIPAARAISAGKDHYVCLKLDGTVFAVGSNQNKQCDIWNWTDIIAVSAGDGYTIGVKSDGTLVATGDNQFGQCDVDGIRIFSQENPEVKRRKAAGKCQHCGGDFKGLLIKKCVSCGTPKDY